MFLNLRTFNITFSCAFYVCYFCLIILSVSRHTSFSSTLYLTLFFPFIASGISVSINVPLSSLSPLSIFLPIHSHLPSLFVLFTFFISCRSLIYLPLHPFDLSICIFLSSEVAGTFSFRKGAEEGRVNSCRGL